MINAYVAHKPNQPLEPFTYEPEELAPHDVEIAITHCGICHSDVHILDGDWGDNYPAVAGHEIIGHVTALGSQVTSLKVGDRVGVGWQSGSCMDCEWCVQGDVNLCAKMVATCKGRFGGFADKIRTDSRFAFPIPDGLSSENAAPLLCGGITVYSPLRHFGITPASKVGVIGIGGLGHLALQFANAFGCEVTAFSTSPDKEAEAKSFGAHHFINTREEGVFKPLKRRYDVILSTVNVNLDWYSYLRALRPNGLLCFVGVTGGKLEIPHHALGGQKSIRTGAIGGRTTIREMLEFAERHNIVAQTEVMPVSEVNTALDKVRNNQARYRMVLEM